jgi:hypothetical protein
VLDGLSDVGGLGPHIPPVATLRNLEAVILGEARVFLVSLGLRERGLELLVVHVGDPLEEEQREDVRLEVCRIYGAA